MEQAFKVATVAGEVIVVGAGITFVAFLVLLVGVAISAGVPVTVGISIGIAL